MRSETAHPATCSRTTTTLALRNRHTRRPGNDGVFFVRTTVLSISSLAKTQQRSRKLARLEPARTLAPVLACLQIDFRGCHPQNPYRRLNAAKRCERVMFVGGVGRLACGAKVRSITLSNMCRARARVSGQE